MSEPKIGDEATCYDCGIRGIRVESPGDGAEGEEELCASGVGRGDLTCEECEDARVAARDEDEDEEEEEDDTKIADLHTTDCNGYCDSEPDFAEQFCPKCDANPCQVEHFGDGSHTCRACLVAAGDAVVARVDWENGCDACWDALRADLASAKLPDWSAADDEGLVPPAWVVDGRGRTCPHGASPCAPSILLVDEVTT